MVAHGSVVTYSIVESIIIMMAARIKYRKVTHSGMVHSRWMVAAKKAVMQSRLHALWLKQSYLLDLWNRGSLSSLLIMILKGLLSIPKSYWENQLFVSWHDDARVGDSYPALVNGNLNVFISSERSWIWRTSHAKTGIVSALQWVELFFEWAKVIMGHFLAKTAESSCEENKIEEPWNSILTKIGCVYFSFLCSQWRN